MEHLPYPSNAILPPLKVPYICNDTEAYDGQGFHDFPSRKGWNGSFDFSLRELARAQSWLYFGLLGAIFGESFNANDFIDTTAEGEQLVTTRTLKALLQKNCGESSDMYKWISRWGFVDPSRRGIVRGRPHIRPDERLTGILKLAEFQSNILDGGDYLATVIALSIKILIWSIGNALATYLPRRRKRLLWIPRHCRLLRGAMLQGGKCPYWTEVYLRNYSPGMIYFLAAMPLMGGRPIHKDCSTQRCIAHDTDDDTYIIEHVNKCSCCDLTGPDPERVEIVIENGSIPLMKLRELPPERLTLDVVQAGYGVHYTAISHVWSGGLGNPFANTLPQRQLESIRKDLRLAQERADADSGLYPWRNRIYKFIFSRKRRHDELFWMDTLCVPVQSGTATRRKAIAQMNLTYAGADNVLVLDPMLRSIPRKTVCKLQLRLQVACSIWMSRCWTFQEACLARAWHVALRDNLYEPGVDYQREANPLFRVMTNQTIWTDKSELECEALSFYKKLWPLVDQDPEYTKHPLVHNKDDADLFELVKIWNELNTRSTTRRKDRLTILAILLDLDAGEIALLDVVDQMQAILSTQNTLPLSLLFQTKSQLPTSNMPKCRWMPLYPECTVTAVYGRMAQDHSRQHYHFTLADVKANGFILDSKYSGLNQVFISQSQPSAFSAWVKMEPRLTDPSNNDDRPRSTCLILSRVKKTTSSLRSSYVGARFTVESSDSDRTSTYTLIYDGALIYDQIISNLPSSTRSLWAWMMAMGRGAFRIGIGRGGWVAVIVVVGSVALIVSGRRFAVMVWATVPGCALLVETGFAVWVGGAVVVDAGWGFGETGTVKVVAVVVDSCSVVLV